MKYNNPNNEINSPRGLDWVAVIFSIIIGVTLTLMVSDFIFGAETVTNWIAGLWMS